MKRTLLTLLLFLIIAPGAHAQALSVSIAPQEYEITSKPARTVTLPYTLTNTGDPMIFRVRVYLVSMNEEDGSYNIIPYYSDNPTMPTFSTTSTEFPLDTPFLLDSNEAVEFDIDIDTNENIRERDYYFAIVGESEPTDGYEESNRMILHGGSGSLVSLTITSDAILDSKGDVTLFAIKDGREFSVGKTVFEVVDSFSHIPFVLRVRNSGNNAVTAEGSIILDAQWGENPASISIPQTRILAGGSRLLKDGAAEKMDVEQDETARVSVGFMNILRAEEYVTIGKNHAPTPQTIHILVLPIRYSIMSSAVLFIILILLMISKYAKRRADRR